MVIDAEVKESQQKTTHRSEWRSAFKKDLTGPTLLEMSGNGVISNEAGRCKSFS